MKIKMWWHGRYLRYPCGLCGHSGEKTGVSVQVLDDNGAVVIDDICYQCLDAAKDGMLKEYLLIVILDLERQIETMREMIVIAEGLTDWPTNEAVSEHERVECGKARGVMWEERTNPELPF